MRARSDVSANPLLEMRGEVEKPVSLATGILVVTGKLKRLRLRKDVIKGETPLVQ